MSVWGAGGAHTSTMAAAAATTDSGVLEHLRGDDLVGLLQDAGDGAGQAGVGGGEEGMRNAGGPRARGSPDAMHVVLGRVGHVVVDHDLDVLHIYEEGRQGEPERARRKYVSRWAGCGERSRTRRPPPTKTKVLPRIACHFASPLPLRAYPAIPGLLVYSADACSDHRNGFCLWNLFTRQPKTVRTRNLIRKQTPALLSGLDRETAPMKSSNRGYKIFTHRLLLVASPSKFVPAEHHRTPRANKPLQLVGDTGQATTAAVFGKSCCCSVRTEPQVRFRGQKCCL